MSRWMKALGAMLASGLLLSGCGLDGAQSTLSPVGPVARVQMDTFLVSFWVSVAVFVCVGSLFLYCLLKFRGPAEIAADAPLPDQGHGGALLEVGIILVSIMLVGIIAFPAVRGVFYAGNLPKDAKDVLVVKVTGLQWWWKFEYPEQGFQTANELALPLGKPVKFELHAPDVIHSFWIPKLGGKVDVMPGQVNWMWLQGDVPGLYYGQCAEFCGDSHAFMRFRARVLPEAEFQEWCNNQRSIALDTKPPKEFSSNQCAACHAIRGVPWALGAVGPDLTHVGSRASLAAGIMDNQIKDPKTGEIIDVTKKNLYSWLSSPGWHKPGNVMWRDGYQKLKIEVTPEEAEVLADYLSRLK